MRTTVRSRYALPTLYANEIYKKIWWNIGLDIFPRILVFKMNFRANYPEKKEYKPGDLVVYIPNHAYNDYCHKDLEFGIVSSLNDSYVFIKIYRNKYHSRTFTETQSHTAQACKRENLIRQVEYERRIGLK